MYSINKLAEGEKLKERIPLIAIKQNPQELIYQGSKLA